MGDNPINAHMKPLEPTQKPTLVNTTYLNIHNIIAYQ